MTANMAKEWGVFIRLNFNNEPITLLNSNKTYLETFHGNLRGLLNNFCKRSFNLLMMISD